MNIDLIVQTLLQKFNKTLSHLENSIRFAAKHLYHQQLMFPQYKNQLIDSEQFS